MMSRGADPDSGGTTSPDRLWHGREYVAVPDRYEPRLEEVASAAQLRRMPVLTGNLHLTAAAELADPQPVGLSRSGDDVGAGRATTYFRLRFVGSLP
jgi:hypothetical protein